MIASSRKIVWLAVSCMAVIAVVIFIVRFPSNYPATTLAVEEKLMSLVESVTLPIKLMKLSMQEPDVQILMPVHGASISRMSNTWQAPRGTDRVHEGQDIFALRGTPVFSGTYGYVRRIDTTTIGGKIVFVTGAGGRRYYYAHLDRIAEGLRVGQEVLTDTVLGFVGNTGNAMTTPPHLHFGVYQSRVAIDPFALLVDR